MLFVSRRLSTTSDRVKAKLRVAVRNSGCNLTLGVGTELYTIARCIKSSEARRIGMGRDEELRQREAMRR